jgi:CRISPR-associated protein Cas5, subtype I-C/DVULG
MAHGIKLLVTGDYACFTRPEMKAERVSYDVMTPSAARGVLEAIHWKPAITWVIDKIHVLHTVRFDSVRRNEVEHKIGINTITSAMKSNAPLQMLVEDSRQQRASLLLRDVAYVIEAHFEMTVKAGEGDNPGKHLDIFNRRARNGQCFHQPYLGCREFAASFALLEPDAPVPVSALKGERDLGWMLYDIAFDADMTPLFYRPTMVDGVIDVQKAWRAAQ